MERGLAYDSFGRELLLLYKTSIPFADTQEPAFLVLSYQSGEQHDASCAAASLAWVPVKHFSSRDGVALAQTEINGGAVSLKPEFVQRQTRALARPRIASGTTIPGATIWENWDVSGWLEIVPGVQVRIDTSSAGFTTVPAYFASLQGGLTERNLNTISLHLDHIDEATPNGFVFRVAVMPFIRFPPEPLEPIPDLRKFFGERKAYVSWLAVESNTKPGETTAPA